MYIYPWHIRPLGLVTTSLPSDQELSGSIPGFIAKELFHTSGGFCTPMSFIHVLSCVVFAGFVILFENENEVYFQQDGAQLHFHANLRNFLVYTINRRWIRRGSA